MASTIPSPIAPPLRGLVVMNQEWRDLTYLHWAVDPALVQPFMPEGCVPDTWEGRTYVGLIPFRMVDAGFGARRRVPYFGDFLETNVRLYSRDRWGRAGVVFLSLDCDRLAVVLGARTLAAVPYRWARMDFEQDGPVVRYRSALRGRTPGTTDLEIEVGPEMAEPGDLDVFLSARFGLHTRIAGRTRFIPNEHPPWPLHHARVLRLEESVTSSVGLPHLGDRAPDHVAFSPGVRTVFGLPAAPERPA